MSYEQSREYSNKSQTAFGVAITCAGFVLETLQVTHGNPKPATKGILSVLAVIFVGALGVGVQLLRKSRNAR